MGNTRDTGHLRDIVIYDGSDNVTFPANVSLVAPAGSDNSTKVPSTAWVRTYVSGVASLSTSGTSGENGSSGSSGQSGAAGSSGSSGSTGTSGSAGTSGSSGSTGSSGSSGQTGAAGSSGSSGSTGTSGSSGQSGAAGSSGSSGQSGAAGSSGSSGSSGQSGAAGSSGSSGQSGAAGSSGSSGQSGAAGSSGSSGSSGQSGAAGSSGSSGQSGSSGSSGQTGGAGSSGSSGSSGQTGGAGSSGSSGSSGQTGGAGSSGSSGSSGQTGGAGSSGSSGSSGQNGAAGSSGSSGATQAFSNVLTMNSGGAGDASGTTYNGSASKTISYNTIGAPSTTGTNASGNWGINVTGNAATVSSITAVQFFNNMGNNHSTHTDFNSITDFGFRYVQGTTNGPGTGSSQFYGMTLGLGNDYAYGSYALQLALPRYNSTDSYISMRSREGGTWGSWYKVKAGYADTAGSATDSTKLPLSGGTMSGPIRRNSHSTGFLEGSYNNVGGNSAYTNPIYTIGSSYNPTDSSLGSMYGIGYAHPNLWGAGKTSDWGMYVCNGGTINATLGYGAVTIWASNDIVAFSDARVKDNVEVVTNAIEKIQAIRGVTFTRKDAALEDRDKRHAGVIAQEVLKVLPEVVTGTEEDMYSVAYGNMAALFIEAIKEQQTQIEDQGSEIRRLKSLIGSLLGKNYK